MSSSGYLIGIDGGGSKTAVALTDACLNLVLLESFPRSNPGDIGADSALLLIHDACLSVLSKASVRADEVIAAFAGIAGGSAGHFPNRVVPLLEEILPNAVCGASDDGVNVLYASFPDRDGVSVICGTGSSCFVKRSGKIIRVGGFGQFDLKGNGFEIGRAAFSHAFRVMDGRDRPSWLAEELNRRFEGGVYRNIIKINQFGKNEFASYAPVVFEAAGEHNDRAAMEILEDHISYIGELIRSAGRFFPGEPYPVSLSGGLTKHPLFLQILARQMNGPEQLILSSKEPWEGALAKANALLKGDLPVTLPEFRALSSR